MRHRISAGLGALATFAVAIGPLRLAAQSLPLHANAAGAAISQSSKNWTPARTADGQPDLQGVWSTSTLTPLERAPEFAGKEFFTEQEAAAYVKGLLQKVNSDHRDANAQTDINGSYNEFWRDRGNDLVADRRTSLIIDPPNGKVPPLTPAAEKTVQQRQAWVRDHPADGPESFTTWERCITRGLPMAPGPYNNDYQIVQTRGDVTVLHEMIHDARIIL